MMHLAGRIADGVIFANGVSEDVIKDNIRRVSEGARSAGRDPSEIELWFFAKPYFAESEEQAWREVAWTLAASANHAFRFSLEEKFVPEEHWEGVRNLQREYASHEHNKKDSGAHNASLVEKNGLSEFLGRRFLIAGSPDRIAERIREIAGHGATNLICTAIFDDQAGYTRRLARRGDERLSRLTRLKIRPDDRRTGHVVRRAESTVDPARTTLARGPRRWRMAPNRRAPRRRTLRRGAAPSLRYAMRSSGAEDP